MGFDLKDGIKVYESNYLKVVYFRDFSLVEMIWKKETKWMSENEYKEEFLIFIELIRELKSTKGIINTKYLYFPIIPNLQEWTNEIIFPVLLSLDANKVAFLVSSINVIQIGIEQTMEESLGQNFLTKFFDDYEEAKQWILDV